MRFVFVPWHNKTATWSNIVHQLLPLKTESSWETWGLCGCRKEVARGCKGSRGLSWVEGLRPFSAPQRRGKKHSKPFSPSSYNTENTRCWGFFFPQKNRDQRICVPRRRESWGTSPSLLMPSLPSHHRNTQNHHPASQENCRTSAPM